jgi:hypothetical protein
MGLSLKQTVTINLSTNASLQQLYVFWKKALDTYFTNDFDPTAPTNEIVFLAPDETSLLFSKEDDESFYIVTIQSPDAQLVRGLVGYIEEVIEENTNDTCA